MNVKRRPNFSDREVDMLIKEVDKRKHILFGNFAMGITKSRKEGLWKEIANLVSEGQEFKRTKEEVKTKWGNIRGNIKTNVANKKVNTKEQEEEKILREK